LNPEILGVNIDELLSAPPAGKWCPFKELNKSDVKGYAHAAAPLHVSGSGRRRTYHLSDGQNHHFGSGDNAVHSRYPVEHRQHHPLGRSLSPAHLRRKKRCKLCLQRFHGTPGATRTHYIPLRSLVFLLVRYTHHNFQLFLIRYDIVWLLVNLHKNP
jgi:hypothetical protein